MAIQYHKKHKYYNWIRYVLTDCDLVLTIHTVHTVRIVLVIKETVDKMCHIYTFYNNEWNADDHNWLKHVPELILLINYNINKSCVQDKHVLPYD